MNARAAGVLNESVEWKLLEGLFRQRTVLISGGFAHVTVAAIGVFRTGHHWFIAWAAAGIVILFARLSIDHFFSRRRVRTGRPKVWQIRFMIGTWASGALCGIGGAASIYGRDTFMQMVVVTMLIAFVMGSTARNAASPLAAVGYVVLALSPLLVALIATRDIYLTLFSLFVIFYAVSSFALTRHMYVQTVSLLCIDQERAALVDEVHRSNLELAAANRQLESMAGTDGLTGVPNRRSFDEALSKMTRPARGTNASISLLMLDIDSFKAYNDRYGHPAGDECLRKVAQTLRSSLRRPSDTLARYGGEEFVAILSHTDSLGASAVAEDMRAAVEGLALAHAATMRGIVTVSIGVATFVNDQSGRTEDLIELADRALYEAKNAGRNRVHVGSFEQPASRLACRTPEEVALL